MALRNSADKIRPLVAKKTPAEPGDWLAQHPERGQTFDQYLTSGPNRPKDQRTTLYLLPIGDFSKAQEPLIKDTEEILRIVFGLPVKVLDPLPDSAIPDTARRTHPRLGMKQFLSTYILDMLKTRRPADAVAVLALTATDLFPQTSWNFVFGQASLNERVGVWSLARYGDAEKDYATVLRRTLLVATHETGHMFGIQHCIASECGMNGSNNLDESDRAPMAFCAECDMKLWWACRLSPATRYAALADFAKSRGITRDEADWRKRAETLASGR
jgi:archaemetzincin